MKNTRTSASAMPRKMRPARLECSMAGAPFSGLAVRACTQAQPVLDEDVRQDVGDEPEDHQKGGRTPDIRILEEFEIGLHLKHHQPVAGAALRHRVDDVELLDRV